MTLSKLAKFTTKLHEGSPSSSDIVLEYRHWPRGPRTKNGVIGFEDAGLGLKGSGLGLSILALTTFDILAYV